MPVRDLLAGDYAAAIDRYEEQYPGISAGGFPVDGSNYRASTYVALALERLGERTRALKLLDQVESVLIGMRRLGIHGYWVTDAQIEAIRGNRPESLKLLTASVQEGWRNLWRFYLFHDPILEVLHENPEFVSVTSFVEQDMMVIPDPGIASRTSSTRPYP
jgi:hypothetical protein